MDLFFDSSALVKRYVAETGSTWATKTVDLGSGNTVFIISNKKASKICAVRLITQNSNKQPKSFLTPELEAALVEALFEMEQIVEMVTYNDTTKRFCNVILSHLKLK